MTAKSAAQPSRKKPARPRLASVDHNTMTRVAVLETNIDQLDKLAEAHESTLDKLSEISYSLKEMLLLQNQRFEQHSEEMKALHQNVKEHAADDLRAIERTHHHVDEAVRTTANYLVQDTDKKIAVLTEHLTRQLDSHKVDMAKLESRLEGMVQQRIAADTELQSQFHGMGKTISDRLYQLEKWRWIIMGGFVVGLVIFHLVGGATLTSLLGS